MLFTCRVAVAMYPLLFVQAVAAKDAVDSEPTTRFVFGIKTQQQDSTMTSLSFQSAPPGLAALANQPAQFKVSGNSQAAFVQLNQRVIPGFHVFGAVGKLQGETVMKVPALPAIQLPDVNIKTDGMTYTLGANALVRKDRYFAALTYAHTLYEPDNALNPSSHSYAVTPAVGVTTDAGTFSLGAVYQKNKQNFLGDVITPLGTVTANAGIENQHKTSWLLEYRTELNKDLYLRGGVELGGRQGLQAAIIKRF